MAKRKKSNSSPDKEQWKKVFGNLVKTIVGDRELYRDRLVSDANLYKERISQLESEIKTLEMIRKVDSKKSDMLIGMKQRDLFVCKAKFDTTVDDLKDLKAAFDCVIQEKNVSQVSALKSERDFVWNQYKTMESEFNEKLNSKKNEIKEANAKIMRLLKDMEQLRSSNDDKDGTIQRLKADVVKLEVASVKKNEELELLRKARDDNSLTPSLRGCSVITSSRVGDKNKGVVDAKKNDVAKTASSSQGTRSSTRKALAISETPKLFTSSFKVPKLKSQSPRVNSRI